MSDEARSKLEAVEDKVCARNEKAKNRQQKSCCMVS